MTFMKGVSEFMNLPLFAGVCYVLWCLVKKVEGIGLDVAVLKEEKRRKDEEEFCQPVHKHEEKYHAG